MIKNVIALAGAILIGALAAAPAAAQYPAKPIHIVLQFPAGGATDAAARILGQALTQSMGQQVLVENRLGADGAIAADVVIKAAPDGYTVFLASNTAMMQVPLLRKKPPYNPVTDFTPIVDPALPVKSVAELFAYARANPSKLNFGSFSSVGQLLYAQMRASTKTDMVLIPYKGEAPAVLEILGGRVHFTFATPASVLSHIKEGKLRPLAILLPKRSALLPEVPTTVEAGMAPFSVETFVSLFGPPHMPRDIVTRLNKEFNAAMHLPGMREQIERNGIALTGSTPDELGSFVRQQLDAWGRAFREAGINPE